MVGAVVITIRYHAHPERDPIEVTKDPLEEGLGLGLLNLEVCLLAVVPNLSLLDLEV